MTANQSSIAASRLACAWGPGQDSTPRMISSLLPRGRVRLAALALAVSAVVAASPERAWADPACSELAYAFQPDCYQPAGDGTCGQTLEHLDFGPQIAVWIETADHALVDTLMVTSLTATRGIGNRPGIWNFRSGPKFPYGKRWMSLPLWAYARGKLFDTAVHAGRSRDAGWASTRRTRRRRSTSAVPWTPDGDQPRRRRRDVPLAELQQREGQARVDDEVVLPAAQRPDDVHEQRLRQRRRDALDVPRERGRPTAR